MIPVEILKKIRRIQITTGRLVTNVFAGEYKSVFKGRGLEFHEVREYMVGDDVRMIDWNVSARSGSSKLYIKKFVEERELTVMLLLDASRSNYFGTTASIKKDIAAEVCSVMAGSAIKNNDRVGIIIFTDRIEKYVPPRKGFRHVTRVIRDALYFKPAGKGTDIPHCLQYLDKVSTRSTISFIVSDFYTPDIKKSLAIANKRHDIVAINILDPRDMSMPDIGIAKLYDAETGKARLVDTSSKSVRDEYAAKAAERIRNVKKVFYATNIDSIDINTAIPYTDALVNFFNRRKKR
ncbi:MAG TPA: DUF58 domain-containing protein [Candidatus Omnitrophota bacterium]|nr:DUF58 domain-containing protein [Candidatus Omnitrophota bacterium]